MSSTTLPLQFDKSSQGDRLLALLESRLGDWVSLPHILNLGIAQYNARIYELRRLGHRIESKQEGDRSWFRLVRHRDDG